MIDKREIGLNRIAYSLAELAELLGVSKNHLRNENIKGNLKFLKCGRRTLITAKEITRYIAELEKGGENVKSK